MPPIARPWFRVYTDMLDNLKAEALTDRQFRFWVKLLALANVTRPRGSLPFPAVIAFRTRTSLPLVIKMLGELSVEGLVDHDGENFVMHDWDEWQKDSDARSTEGRRMRGDSAADAPHNDGASAADAPRTRRLDRDRDRDRDSDSDQEREKEGDTEEDVRTRRARMKPLLNLTAEEWQQVQTEFQGRGDINARFIEWLDWIGEREGERWPKKGNLVAFQGFLRKKSAIQYSAGGAPPMLLRDAAGAR